MLIFNSFPYSSKFKGLKETSSYLENQKTPNEPDDIRSEYGIFSKHRQNSGATCDSIKKELRKRNITKASPRRFMETSLDKQA